MQLPEYNLHKIAVDGDLFIDFISFSVVCCNIFNKTTFFIFVVLKK